MLTRARSSRRRLAALCTLLLAIFRAATLGDVSELKVEGMLYKQATISSVDAQTVTIMHSAGVARIPIAALSDDQIAALNSSSTTLKIQRRVAASQKVPDKATHEQADAAQTPVSAHPQSDDGDSAAKTGASVSANPGASQPWLGSSVDAFFKQFGPPLYRKAVSDKELGEERIGYQRNGFGQEIYLSHGKAVGIVYFKRPLTDDEIDVILSDHSADGEWLRNDDPLTSKDWQLVRSDGDAFAFISRHSMEYNLRNHIEDRLGFVTKEQAARAAVKNAAAAEQEDEKLRKEQEAREKRAEELRKRASGM